MGMRQMITRKRRERIRSTWGCRSWCIRRWVNWRCRKSQLTMIVLQITRSFDTSSRSSQNRRRSGRISNGRTISKRRRIRCQGWRKRATRFQMWVKRRVRFQRCGNGRYYRRTRRWDSDRSFLSTTECFLGVSTLVCCYVMPLEA